MRPTVVWFVLSQRRMTRLFTKHEGSFLLSIVAAVASLSPTPARASTAVHTIDLCPDDGVGPRCHAKIVVDDNGVPVHSMNAPVGGYTPAELQSAYGLPAGGGEGRLVALWASDSDYVNAESDLAVYRAEFNLPPCTSQNGCFKKIDDQGGTNYPPPGTNEGEQALDMEMASAACPGCRILIVEGSSAQTALATVQAMGVSAFSFSIDGSHGEAANVTECQTWGFDDTHGVLVTAALGDSGYPGTAAWFPTICQGVLAVGGTKLEKDTSPRGWSEIAWGGSGSGCDTLMGKPAWQTDPGCAGRMTGDISAVASPYPGVAFYVTTGGQGWGTIGGTSAAAPLVAGALTNLGIANGSFSPSWIWKNAANLYDITSGSTNGCADAGVPQYYCEAEPGYDGPSGWGTPNGALLAGALPPGADLDGGSCDMPNGPYAQTCTTCEVGVRKSGCALVCQWCMANDGSQNQGPVLALPCAGSVVNDDGTLRCDATAGDASVADATADAADDGATAPGDAGGAADDASRGQGDGGSRAGGSGGGCAAAGTAAAAGGWQPALLVLAIGAVVGRRRAARASRIARVR